VQNARWPVSQGGECGKRKGIQGMKHSICDQGVVCVGRPLSPVTAYFQETRRPRPLAADINQIVSPSEHTTRPTANRNRIGGGKDGRAHIHS